MHQFSAHAVDHSPTTDDQTSDSNLAVSYSHTETDTESTSDSEKSYADITRILMVQPDQPPQGQTSHTEPYVDIPSDIDQEMPESSATNQPPQLRPKPVHPIKNRRMVHGATTQSILREFATRFMGALRDWFDSLDRYRQLQFVDLPEVLSALAVLHDQFLGDPSAVFEAARRDYLNMKCCSLNAKDLDFHYKRMSLLFYKLNGFNEPTLKHVFLTSLPDELQPDIQRQLTASNLSLDNISLGKIFQLAKTCLDKLCEEKQFFKELLKDKEPFRSACKKPYLQIKCKKKKDCDCNPKKKRHFKKFRNPEFSSRPRRSRKPYRFFQKKSSSSRDFKRRKSSRCFICKKKGHYAKDCPNKREKSIRLVEHLQATTDYSPEKDELEFYFSEQDEPNYETVFALQNFSDDSDSDQSQVIFHQQPIPAISLIGTGAQRSMLNPHLLPPEYWTDYEEHFKAVNGKLFTTSLITKKSIGIQFFPNCVIWTKVISSTLPNKDLLLGFDILHQIKHLQILPNGIRVKSMFKPFTDILKLYNLSETPQPYQDISTKLLSFCPESHSEFTHPNLLWKNKSFFIKLPFKLNGDINPTKATHPGMSPSDLLLAQQECSQLLAQGLIEPTNSQWACQAFYVENYQPLNMFLQDDKFPLPRRQSMFTFLKNAQIFSKFDLKSGSHDEHRQLLTQFYDIVQSHGIMLSAKKSTIATDNIEFLDASDDSWGAILLEEINGKEHFIAYASGQFSDTQKHYHSVLKEILAVKNGIKKFEYHLIGHHFLIRMDSSAFPNILNFKGLTLDPSRETTEDVLWYIWCLTVLYATKLVLPITPTLEHLLDPDKATSLTWTLLEWFSPIPWWRKKLQQLSEIYNLERMPAPEAQLFTSVFIIHRPYFQHPDTNLFWTQDQVYEWFIAPHPAVIDNEIQDVLHNYLCQLNHQPPPLKDIFHTSLGPQHDLLMIPTPSAISNPKSTGSSYQPPKADTATKPSKVDKATQTSPRPGYRRDCPYPPCRGPHYRGLVLSPLRIVLYKGFSPCLRRKNISFMASTLSSPSVTLSSTISLPRSCTSHTTNKIENLVEYSCWARSKSEGLIPGRRENFSFMASTSSSSPVTLSLPRSCTSHTTNKIENLVEYSYITESAQISESSYPLISPYQLYKRPSSFTRCIRTLISTRRPHPKEYIQSSHLDQCALQATFAEQYVTLEIPSKLLTNRKREGYTHLHLGSIRLIFTLHGRKGLPVTVRLAMLDTRFKQYQDDVISTVLTILHAGSVLLTFYPNFNLSLQDPNLPTTLKVQVQIQGAEQISSAKIATLHHQLVYRLQNHALDLPTPEHHSDTLMVLAESDQIPTIIQIPRQIPRHELIKLMPLEWISNYEQFHNNTAPIQTSESMFERRQDGTVRVTFKSPPSAPQEPPRLSFTYSSMITAVQIA
ncbi:hypothetical protein KPL71_001197 [Citrus sinensis]|uniref:Uncharacterized protein n=1 Tax=Citrus sinensis TaxID=2711 RepID=A0ACB8NUV4_CITSI|nr:hypothetical protein KPL71_001197 [Citrus sinensis]